VDEKSGLLITCSLLIGLAKCGGAMLKTSFDHSSMEALLQQNVHLTLKAVKKPNVGYPRLQMIKRSWTPYLKTV